VRILTKRAEARLRAEWRKQVRRQLVDTLREYPTAVVCLDRTELRDVTINGPLLVLGDDTLVSGCIVVKGEAP
jgi:hypothetical protein